LTALLPAQRFSWNVRMMRRAAILACMALGLVMNGRTHGAEQAPASLPGTLEPLAGRFAGPGNVDGAGPLARFNHPGALALDAAGNLYVADSFNDAVRKITPGGVVSTLPSVPRVESGRWGSLPGGPTGLVFNQAGELLVLYSSNADVLKIAVDGSATWLPEWTVGRWNRVEWIGHQTIAMDRNGNFFVAQEANQTIRKISPDGTSILFAGAAGQRGKADGVGPAARFTAPIGLAVDPGGNVYVADRDNGIRKITPAGAVGTFARLGRGVDANGKAIPLGFEELGSIASDTAGNLFIADRLVHWFTPEGQGRVLAGHYIGGDAKARSALASFGQLSGLAVDNTNGDVYVADESHHNIRKITPDGEVTTLAGPPAPPPVDIFSPSVLLKPAGIAADAAGNVYVTDDDSMIRKVTPDGKVTTLAGVQEKGRSIDGTGRAARFHRMAPSISIDAAGNLYVVEDSYRIRRITPDGEVRTVAQGNSQPAGDGRRHNRQPQLAVGADGSLYLADSNNWIIRKIPAGGGDESTWAGQTAGRPDTLDGPGTQARFSGMAGIASDAGGNLYVSDPARHVIRKIGPDAKVTTLAGSAGHSGSDDGRGPAARFKMPLGLATDAAGNVYVADSGNHLVRRITPEGVVSTVAGTRGRVGFVAGAPVPGVLRAPSAVAVSGTSLYILTYAAVAVLRNLRVGPD
jgi:sugar lactone lactonase YvrE